MSKITQALQGKKSLITFLTAGDPSLEHTEEYILAMAEAGADLIEIGIPFSDPVAEGEIIEAANARALQAGTTLDGIFSMLQRVRQKINIPLVFLSYINPIFTYGYAAFFQSCQESGIAGVIIPDLPFDETIEKHLITPHANKHHIDIISLIAPTSATRIEAIARQANGFIYLVSSMGVTGVRSEFSTNLHTITNHINSHSTLPVCVGFGISTSEQVAEVTKYADGAIVGSAVVKIIAEHKTNAKEPLMHFVKELKSALVATEKHKN